MLGLPLIPLDKYADFCCGLFEDYGKRLDREVVRTLYKKFRGVTLYMHKVMNELFITTLEGQTCESDAVEGAIEKLINDGAEGYSTLYYQMSERQRDLLLAIARDEEAEAINSAAFINKHSLVSQSAVASAAKILLDKDIITKDNNVYTVYDQIFGLWIRHKLLGCPSSKS